MLLYLESLGESLRKQWPKVNRYWKVQSTFALRTPRYNGHPDKTDSS